LWQISHKSEKDVILPSQSTVLLWINNFCNPISSTTYNHGQSCLFVEIVSWQITVLLSCSFSNDHVCFTYKMTIFSRLHYVVYMYLPSIKACSNKFELSSNIEVEVFPISLIYLLLSIRKFSLPVWYIPYYWWGYFPYQFDISFVIDEDIFLQVWNIPYYRWGNFLYQFEISHIIDKENFPTSLIYPVLSMRKFFLPVIYICFYR